MRICIVVDDGRHCYATTMRELVACLPQHRMLTITAAQYLGNPGASDSQDLVYFRGWWGSLRRPPKAPWITTITTGGVTAEERMLAVRSSGNATMRAIVAQCASVQMAALHIKLPAVAMIPNGVNIKTFRPTRRPGHGIGLAAKMVSVARNELKGAGMLEEAAKAAAEPLCIVDSMAHVDMPAWYQSLWAYCQPSSREGCSNSVMEAMATGLPVLICKGVGYHGETCRDAREHPDGEVLFVERNFNDISSTLQLLRSDAALYARLSSNARRFAVAHAWPIIAKRFDDLFRWAVGEA